MLRIIINVNEIKLLNFKIILKYNLDITTIILGKRILDLVKV